ncbi:MAG: hypothetical protein QM756_15310 [Polyangiaceae bacterium]
MCLGLAGSFGCSSNQSTPSTAGEGGAVTANGGSSASGGTVLAAGGNLASGGTVPTSGGTPSASGGGAATGGSTPASGGALATGGTSSATSGGTSPTGGSATTGSGGSAGATTGATCTTAPIGTGAAFPTLDNYTARDGGFGPAVVVRNTGDDSLGTNTDGTANKVAIFRPAAAKYGQGGVTHPIVVWGNGSTNTVDIWQSFLGRVASYGFVVVAPEQTQVTADHMNKAVDYVVRLAADAASGDCGKVDTTKIASTGYSRGGGGAISVGSNVRIKTTFFFASNGNVNNLKAPWGVVGGDMDTTFNWTAISSAVTGSTQPAFGAALAGIDHNRVAGNAKAQEAYIGWLRWRFMGDAAGHDLFVGASCKACSDTAFSGVVKTPSFDAL